MASEKGQEPDEAVAQDAASSSSPPQSATKQEKSSSSSPSPETSEKSSSPPSKWNKLKSIVLWTPPQCRWDPEKPPVFSMPMNVLFGFAGAFTVANLYYNHPILNVLAHDFGVKYDTVSQIPTLAQSGYAVGLFFLCPLGDMLKRRTFTLSLIWFTATLWIGLCVTNSFAVFSAITFLTGLTTVTPQIMLPLVGDLAPPHRRASALSIVTAGNLLGILLARLLSGVVTEYTSWRSIYWVAFGLQYFILGLLWLFMPDYPATNPNLNYFRALLDVIRMPGRHPVLLQACLVALATSAPFTSYWTTLTFLLSTQYHFSSLVIGLWALIGIGGLCVTPVLARTVIDAHVPWFSVVLGELLNIVGITLGTYTGLISPAGPAIQAFLIDVGLQTTQIANRSAIYAVAPQARNRVNTAYMVATFLGQITGTAAGNRLYARGGWVASGSLSVGLIGFALVICAARGPWEKGWVGWSGGYGMRKLDKTSADGRTAEQAHHTKAVEKEDEEAGGGAEVKEEKSESDGAERDENEVGKSEE